ncbi:MAG: vitamin K epoxide reductase family protein, partial [Candidatus Paceibacteria bacterium]
MSMVTQYTYSIVLAILGALGLLAAFMVTVDIMHLAENAQYQPACSVNTWVNCKPVMESKYATMFGFPNPWIGLMGWPMSMLFAFYLATHREYS